MEYVTFNNETRSASVLLSQNNRDAEYTETVGTLSATLSKSDIDLEFLAEFTVTIPSNKCLVEKQDFTLSQVRIKYKVGQAATTLALPDVRQ